MRQEKKAWEKNKLSSTTKDPSSLWKNVKKWLNWSNSGPPTRLFYNGRMVSSLAGIAGAMHSFFLGKVAGLRESIPESGTNPMKKLKEAMGSRHSTFSLGAVSCNDVLEVMKALKNSKPTGTDNIDTYVIKLVAQDLVSPLTHINN